MSSSWGPTPPQSSRHYTSAAEGDVFEVPEIQPPRWPPMSRMQLFSTKADIELQRLAEAAAAGSENAFLGEPGEAEAEYLTDVTDTDEPELQMALRCLLRAETACDFAGAVKEAEAAARSARPEDAEKVASMAAAASARLRASQRAAAHQAHIVDVIREPVPLAEGSGECAMEVIGYVGVTGNGGLR